MSGRSSIGILGSGTAARTLGAALVKHGHPDALVVKTLNTVAADVMVDPAKQTVSALLEDFGRPIIDMGGIESARWIEALSLAWVVYSHRTGNTITHSSSSASSSSVGVCDRSQ